ncbi:MAG: ArsC/Spx/MgsR family protein [Pseudomonadota bacterium]
MTDLTVYGLKICDTCRKALKALEAAGRSVRFVDVRADGGVSRDQIEVWLAAVGAAALVNTRSTTWRGLDEAARARAETDAAGLLHEHPALIKRPVIETGAAVHVGWTKPVQAALGV